MSVRYKKYVAPSEGSDDENKTPRPLFSPEHSRRPFSVLAENHYAENAADESGKDRPSRTLHATEAQKELLQSLVDAAQAYSAKKDSSSMAALVQRFRELKAQQDEVAETSRANASRTEPISENTPPQNSASPRKTSVVASAKAKTRSVGMKPNTPPAKLPTPQRRRPWTLGWTVRTVFKIFDAWNSAGRGSSTRTFSKFVYEYFSNILGLGRLVVEAAEEMMNAVRHYREDHADVELFAMFLSGVFSDSEISFYTRSRDPFLRMLRSDQASATSSRSPADKKITNQDLYLYSHRLESAFRCVLLPEGGHRTEFSNEFVQDFTSKVHERWDHDRDCIPASLFLFLLLDTYVVYTRSGNNSGMYAAWHPSRRGDMNKRMASGWEKYSPGRQRGTLPSEDNEDGEGAEGPYIWMGVDQSPSSGTNPVAVMRGSISPRQRGVRFPDDNLAEYQYFDPSSPALPQVAQVRMPAGTRVDSPTRAHRKKSRTPSPSHNTPPGMEMPSTPSPLRSSRGRRRSPKRRQHRGTDGEKCFDDYRFDMGTFDTTPLKERAKSPSHHSRSPARRHTHVGNTGTEQSADRKSTEFWRRKRSASPVPRKSTTSGQNLPGDRNVEEVSMRRSKSPAESSHRDVTPVDDEGSYKPELFYCDDIGADVRPDGLDVFLASLGDGDSVARSSTSSPLVFPPQSPTSRGVRSPFRYDKKSAGDYVNSMGKLVQSTVVPELPAPGIDTDGEASVGFSMPDIPKDLEPFLRETLNPTPAKKLILVQKR